MALLGLIIGIVAGALLTIPVTIFLSNRIKAAQISMMTKGVVEGELPEHTFHQGFVEIRGRFGKITAFYFITQAIKGIFHEISRGINQIGTAIGGDVGNGVTSAVNSAVETLLAYLCDCCLGWILFRKEENSFKAGCEGAVIFFKHGKSLIRNVGRIFGMGFLSLILVGGAFFGGLYGIFTLTPGMFTTLAAEIAEAAARGEADLPEFLTNPTALMLIIAGVGALILWGIFHSVLIRPFILVGVLRNYMKAGIENMPTEEDFKELDSKSPKFAKLHSKF